MRGATVRVGPPASGGAQTRGTATRRAMPTHVEKTGNREGQTMLRSGDKSGAGHDERKPKYLDQDTDSSDDASSGNSSADEDEQSWISWFCSLKGNEFFCEVDEEYIQDDFNLSGLSGMVPYYDYALDLILDVESPNDDMLTEQQHELVESAAEMLYGGEPTAVRGARSRIGPPRKNSRRGGDLV